MEIWKNGNKVNGNTEDWKYGRMKIQKNGNKEECEYGRM